MDQNSYITLLLCVILLAIALLCFLSVFSVMVLRDDVSSLSFGLEGKDLVL